MLDKQKLLHEYIDLKQTIATIANKYNIGSTKVGSLLKAYQITIRNGGMPLNDLKGKRFGELLVLYRVGTKNKSPLWKCRCNCGNICNIVGHALTHGQQHCKNCVHKYIGEQRWKGYKEISGAHFNRIKQRAKSRNLQFDLTIEYLWELFLQQNRKCILSGLELIFARPDRINTTASLDRIDSSKGYVKNNVQWIHKILNHIKSDISQKEFIEWCKRVASYNE